MEAATLTFSPGRRPGPGVTALQVSDVTVLCKAKARRLVDAALDTWLPICAA